MIGFRRIIPNCGTQENRQTAKVILLAGVLTLISACTQTTAVKESPTQSVVGSSVALQAAYDAGRWGEAEYHARQYLKVQPTDSRSWFLLANSLVEQDRLSPAIDAYQTALALDPKFHQARHNLGLIYLRLGADEIVKARDQMPEDAKGQELGVYVEGLLKSLLAPR